MPWSMYDYQNREEAAPPTPWNWNYTPKSKAGFGDLEPMLSGLLTNQGAMAGNIGYNTLASILASQGKTDPTWMNLMQQSISRGGEGTQTAIDQMLAGRGWENSGIGAALKQAGMGATENKQAAFKTQQAQLAEERKRADLELLYKMFIGPSLEGSGINAGLAGINAQTSANKSAQQQQMLMTLAALAFL